MKNYIRHIVGLLEKASLQNWANPVTRLLLHVDGIEADLESIGDFPAVGIHGIVSGWPDSLSGDTRFLAAQLAQLPVFKYRVINGRIAWNPLEETYSSFIQKHPDARCIWIGTAYPDEKRVADWLLAGIH